jgi:hypothetical protein
MNQTEHLNKMQEQLYSRGGSTPMPIREHELPPKTFDSVPKDWQDTPPPQTPPPSFKNEKKGSFVFWILLFSIIFFMAAAAYAYFTITRGTNTVSSENIAVEISGPISIAGGEKLPLDVSIVNKNKGPLRLVEFIIEYPPGTRSPVDSSVALSNERMVIGDMNPGESVHKEIQAILYGEEASVANIRMIVEYRLPNSNAIFQKEVPYQIALNSNPTSLTVEAPHETISGQMFSFNITVRSNSTEVLRDVLVEGDYPAGFQFKESIPAPKENKSSWKLGDIPPGESRSVILRGVLTGENDDSRTFRFQTGLGSDRNTESIETPFSVFKHEVAISKPFMGLELSVLNSRDSEVSVSATDPVRVDVSYINNLPISLRNARIEINLSGTGLDEKEVVVDRGFYQSATNIISWTEDTLPALAEIAPQSRGTVSFTLKPRTATIQNPEIKMSGSVYGIRGQGDGVPESFVDVAQKRIIVQTQASLTSKSNYSSGPIKNTGGIPPHAEKETTYTITWRLTNTTNDIVNGRVVATLPSYVRFLGQTSPSTESVSGSEVGGNVVWDVGEIASGVGFVKPAKEVSFKVGFTGSLSQVGTVPTLVNQAQFSGEDRFGKVKINATSPAVTTRVSDSQFRTGDDIVVQ